MVSRGSSNFVSSTQRSDVCVCVVRPLSMHRATREETGRDWARALRCLRRYESVRETWRESLCVYVCVLKFITNLCIPLCVHKTQEPKNSANEYRRGGDRDLVRVFLSLRALPPHLPPTCLSMVADHVASFASRDKQPDSTAKSTRSQVHGHFARSPQPEPVR